MKKFILILLILRMVPEAEASSYPQKDTVYIYETKIVYDTVKVLDTLRLKRTFRKEKISPPALALPFYSPLTATYSRSGIIIFENKNYNFKNRDEMKFEKKSFLSAVMLMLYGITGISAQGYQPEPELRDFPLQLSFVYPMTMQGKEATEYNYNFSFNMLTGRVGAVTGLEFGGLYNHVEYGVNGVQAAGLGNRTNSLKGIQFGGLWNRLSGNALGVQFAGIFNSAADIKGVQFAGIFSIGQEIKGVQFGGVSALVENITGFQFGGVASITDRMKGAQFGGICNVAREMIGFQFGGVVNVNEKSRGGRFAGIANIGEESLGANFAGVANIMKTSYATEMAPVNKIDTLKGVALGLVNVIDTVDGGVSVGLINIVKRGFYKEWEFSLSDYANISVTYKHGMKNYYSIYTVGVNFLEDNLWIAGIGVGHRSAVTQKLDLQPELITYSYFPNDFKMKKVFTVVSRLKMGLVYSIGKKTDISLAPSFYYLNSDRQEGVKEFKITPITPIHSKKYEKTRHELGWGVSLSLILK